MTIPGYTYDSATVPTSPTSVAEMEELKRTLLFTEEDHTQLRVVGELLLEQIDEVFGYWMSLFGPLFMSAFVGPNGQPDERYLHAVHPRFIRWVQDTCARRYDQVWLDYQHEIGLRHYTKKNETDGAQSTPHVPLRHLLALAYPMSTIRHFLTRRGHSADEVDRMQQAWTKALLLSIVLWSRPYVHDGAW